MTRWHIIWSSNAASTAAAGAARAPHLLLGWVLLVRLILPAAACRKLLLPALQRGRRLRRRLQARLRGPAQRPVLRLRRLAAPGPLVAPEGRLLRRLPLPLLHVGLQGRGRQGAGVDIPGLHVQRPGALAAAGAQAPLGQSLLEVRQRLLGEVLHAGPVPLRHGVLQKQGAAEPSQKKNNESKQDPDNFAPLMRGGCDIPQDT